MSIYRVPSGDPFPGVRGVVPPEDKGCGVRPIRWRFLPSGALHSDSLRGVCHCGAVHLAEDPEQVWSWLLAHPEGHELPANLPALHPR
jgi:hypothetical protein